MVTIARNRGRYEEVIAWCVMTGARGLGLALAYDECEQAEYEVAAQRRLAVGVAYDALFVHGPLAVFLAGALVVVLLTLGQRDLALHQVALPIQLYGNAGVAFLIDVGKQLGELFVVQQQLLNAGGVGDHVGAGGV